MVLNKRTLLIFAVLWTIIITFLSIVTVDNLDSLISIPFKDKIVHFILYFVFVVVWSTYKKTEKYTLKVGIFIMFIAICYGILMELFQGYFTENRHAESIDVIANSTGALFGLLFINNYFLNKRKI